MTWKRGVRSIILKAHEESEVDLLFGEYWLTALLLPFLKHVLLLDLLFAHGTPTFLKVELELLLFYSSLGCKNGGINLLKFIDLFFCIALCNLGTFRIF